MGAKLTLESNSGRMKANSATQLMAMVDRRAESRMRVACAARLITLGADRHGQLWDISTAGARVEISEPPTKGATALLKWLTHEQLCTVVWVADGKCGVRFDKPISSELVAECRDFRLSRTGVKLERMTVGRKRSAPLAQALPETAGATAPFHWSLVITFAARKSPIADMAQMTVAEQMFFLGSPLAHVLAYQTRAKVRHC